MLIRKPRVRFQWQSKKGKRDDAGKAQREPVRTIHVGNPETTLFEGIGEASLFARKRVPSVDELGTILRSNLSTSLAAARASSVKHSATYPPSTPTGNVVAQPHERDDDPPASFLELAPMYRPVDDHLVPTDSRGIMDDEGNGDDGPPASLLATTAIYRPVNDRLEPAAQDLTTAVSIAESCAIEDDDDPPASLLVENRESLMNYIKSAPRSGTEPLQPSKCHLTLLQKVVGLFAGRRQCSFISEDRPEIVSNQSKVQKPSSPTATNLPSAPLSRRIVSDPNLPLRKSIPRRNLPLSPPILVTHHPYRPLQENLDEPFIAPAKEHDYTGDYSVAQDVFNPAEIHQGFASPTSPVSATLAIRRQNSAAMLLDRDATAWGK
ncbi:uncharacterized protein EKO05_0008247 [Ascochyta rabiei]|uniref:Uncharacterized protein n=1 Tax=Didymella rabiei TaxID=5454 RepID=A0A163DG79_DIDRA|nr:uncharacterized protein EKO05_0008247 [Ascochyta rabiei]KZM23134.1 hypothetical protein ST47_g5788 [Ascochyta rabiei]UPX17921.1 hypothetical protein EKO05_0008247 [Ascochyta rabiei]